MRHPVLQLLSEITVVCGASHSRGWSGSLQAAPLPTVSLPHLRGLGSQPVVCPQTLRVSLSWSLSHPAPDTLIAGPVVVWICSPGSFLFKRRGGKRRCWELGAREGSFWQRPQTLSHFLPFPRVTSNHIFLLHTLLTRSCLRPPTAPHTHSWRGPWLGERGDLGTEETGGGTGRHLRAPGTGR